MPGEGGFLETCMIEEGKHGQGILPRICSDGRRNGIVWIGCCVTPPWQRLRRFRHHDRDMELQYGGARCREESVRTETRYLSRAPEAPRKALKQFLAAGVTVLRTLPYPAWNPGVHMAGTGRWRGDFSLSV